MEIGGEDAGKGEDDAEGMEERPQTSQQSLAVEHQQQQQQQFSSSSTKEERSQTQPSDGDSLSGSEPR